MEAQKGENGEDGISLDKEIADSLNLTILKSTSAKKEITFKINEGKKGSCECTFMIPKEMIRFREAAELTLHPVSCGGCYYELKLGDKGVGEEGEVRETTTTARIHFNNV